MSKDKKANRFTPDLITGECRITTIAGKVIAGKPVGWFDDAVIIESVSSDTVVVRLDAIEAVWDSLVSPRTAKELGQEDKTDGEPKDKKDGLQKPQ